MCFPRRMSDPATPAIQAAAPAAVETVLSNVTPGAQTSEFRLVLAVILLTALGGATQYLPAEWAVIASGVLAAGWTLTRLFYKFQLGQLHVDQVLGMADAGTPLSMLLNAAAEKKLGEALAPPAPAVDRSIPPVNELAARRSESGSTTAGDLAKLCALCMLCLLLAACMPAAREAVGFRTGAAAGEEATR